ncbi:MAG TPA: FIST C-terminal domain-containing protein, partial [Acidimicrobiia bacterium]|nr:FIST C-terminal domain-containing protein [Acidimicrobiia bacterium]
DLAGVLVLSDGLHVNGSELVRGISGRFGSNVPVTGGLAADGDRFEHTWVIVDGFPVERQVVAVGFYGESVRFHHGSRAGWDIFGPERLITRSEGNVLFELDGRPALQLYKQYLGDLADGLPATGLLFPLAVRQDPDDRFLVRTILAVDEAEQSLTFAGDVPVGMRAQLMQANVDRLIGGAEQAAKEARNDAAGPVLSVAISCVGRRLVMGDRTEEEVEATVEWLPAGSHQVGFYAYGEISPYSDGTCDLHNQTMTLTTISEMV